MTLKRTRPHVIDTIDWKANRITCTCGWSGGLYHREERRGTAPIDTPTGEWDDHRRAVGTYDSRHDQPRRTDPDDLVRSP